MSEPIVITAICTRVDKNSDVIVNATREIIRAYPYNDLHFDIIGGGDVQVSRQNWEPERNKTYRITIEEA